MDVNMQVLPIKAYSIPLQIDRICRTCLAENSNMTSLYGTRLNEMLNLLGIKVHEGDGLPHLMCIQCAYQCGYAYSFKQVCLKAENVLQQYLNEKKNREKLRSIRKQARPHTSDEREETKIVANEIRTETENIIINVKIEDTGGEEMGQIEAVQEAEITRIKEENQEKEVAISYEIKEKEILELLGDDRQRAKIKEEIEDEEETATVKNEFYATEIDIIDVNEDIKEESTDSTELIHTEDIHEEVFTESHKSGENNNEKVHHCHLCKVSFKNSSALLEHMLTQHTENTLFCQYCNQKFKHMKDLKVHVRSHGTGSTFKGVKVGPYKDDFCRKTFPPQHFMHIIDIHKGQKVLLQEIKERPPDGMETMRADFVSGESMDSEKAPEQTQVLQCPFCVKKFKREYFLRCHLRTHTGEKPFECKYCKKSLISKKLLENHLRMHADEEVNKCKLCHKTFCSPNTLKSHMSTHDKERYKCNVCDKKFQFPNKLKLHMRFHTGDQFTCQYCDKKYVHEGQFLVHVRSHTGEKPYKCSFCSKAYADKSVLRCHLKIHTGVKPFECHICHSRFNQSSTLKCHMNVHAEDKSYKCDLCDKAYGGKERLRIHKQKHKKKNKTLN